MDSEIVSRKKKIIVIWNIAKRINKEMVVLKEKGRMRVDKELSVDFLVAVVKAQFGCRDETAKDYVTTLLDCGVFDDVGNRYFIRDEVGVGLVACFTGRLEKK